jgi:hypothetical protein
MASGLPDWKLALNIEGQQSGYLTQRPSYGAATLASFAGNITPSDWKTLISITGAGVIYGGFISVDAAQSQSTDSGLIAIDGSNFIGSNFAWVNTRGLTHPLNDILFLQHYDNVNFIYVLGINPGFTFESSVVVQYLEALGNTFAVNCKLYYALRT